MEFGRAFSYVFEDPDWLKKVGIAAVVFLIPVIGPFVAMGWSLEITRRVINLDTQPLPDWSDFGGYVSKGFQAFVVTLAYILPVILIAICGQVVIVGAGTGLAESNPDLAGGVATAVGICMGCFVLIFGILGGLLIPPALGTLAASGQLGSAFRFAEIFGLLRAAIGPYLISMLLVGLASSVLTSIGSVACGIGALVAAAYVQALSGHLYGQAYNAAKANQGAAAVAQM